MEKNPIKNDARRTARESQIGSERTCRLCQEADIASLTRGPRSLLEEHHVVGQANDPDLTITLCFNCHRKLTERMRANGTSMHTPKTCLDQLVAFLLGLAAFFRMLSEKLTEWASKPGNLATALDTNYPNWRTMPEAA